MPKSEPAFYDRAIRRIGLLIIALGFLGAAALAILQGFRAGLGFAIGAVVSYASFRGWQRLVAALVPAAKRGPPWFMLRIFVLIGVAYVIIKFLGLNIAAALGGLLVSAAAVILELVYELIYART